MAWTTAVAWIVVVIVVIAVLAYALSGHIGLPGASTTAIQMTDPPSVPAGTSALVVTYSSVQVQSSGTNQSGWIDAQGSGSVNLMAVQNSSQTIATANLAANSTVSAVRFVVTSAQITINGTTYNVATPNSQVDTTISGSGRINSSASGASAVLINFYPTVSAQGSSNSSAYVMSNSATAIVINSNASISINTNIGSTASISSAIRSRLGILASGSAGLGGVIGGSGSGSASGGASGNGSASGSASSSTQANGTVNGTIVASAGERVRNFAIQSINYANSTVTGYLYAEYPVASSTGVYTTLYIDSTVGYSCDNSLAELTSVNSNGTATFTTFTGTATSSGCPV